MSLCTTRRAARRCRVALWLPLLLIAGPSPAAEGAARVPGFWTDIKPILDARCVVCHACFDAPCQLNLGSWQGLARGASGKRVYDGMRLTATEPTRLHIDAGNVAAWREKGFHPVIDEAGREGRAAASGSLLYRLLELKRDHPLPADPVLPGGFDFSLDRSQTCPRAEDFERYAEANPLAGMPYGLPGIRADRRKVIADWLAAGAPVEAEAPLPVAAQRQVEEWERFLNGDSLRQRLTARYLYEHLFIGHLYIEAGGERYWFRLIRSFDPPGEAADPIASRQPFDDPGAGRVYYHLVPWQDTRVAKTHMPYRLDDARMARWRALFLDGLPAVAALPGYGRDSSSNPFVTFRDIPVAARYRFLLDDAGYFVEGFIKGPVCRGQVALNVINDRFWVFFAAPSSHTPAVDLFLARQAGTLTLPADDVSPLPLVSWNAYRGREAAYLKARSEFLREQVGVSIPLDMSVVWDGDGHNANAALTVFRHFDSASVVRGLVEPPPKTAWLITYPILERIHYLLVAGFDVFGNAGHQLNSRLYMDFLRMESETNLLALLPLEMRPKVVERWYRGDAQEVKDKFYNDQRRFGVDTAIRYRSDDPLAELFDLLRARVAPVTTHWAKPAGSGGRLESLLQALASISGTALQWLPETSFLRVVRKGGADADFTLLRNSAHDNVSHLFAERLRRRPEDDTLTVVDGFLGAYPNAFLRVEEARLPELVAGIEGLDDEAGYRSLADRFAVRRTDQRFWQHLDALHEAARERDPLGFGLFDLNRFENR